MKAISTSSKPMSPPILIPVRDVRSTKAGYEQLAELSQRISPLFFENIQLDFSLCKWFDANMCAPLGVILANGFNNFNSFSFERLSNEVKGILSKNHFLAGFGVPILGDTYSTTMPYRRFNLSDDRLFAEYLNVNMKNKGLPKMTPSLDQKFKSNILEVFSNAALHSESKEGIFACGQYFPKKHRMDFCIADSGIGIRRKIYKNLGLILNSDQAIAWALQEGNTTRKGNVPGGLGLKIIKEFITLNNGRLQIISDRGFWEYGSQGENLSRMETSFPGTVLNIEINTQDSKSYRLSTENSH